MPPGRVRQAITGQAIATDALKYRGRGYVFGGTASSPGDWDCSSFVSYVLGHDLRLPLPGGQWGDPGFPPNAHGPVVDDYASWDGANPVAQGQEQAGDLVLWVGAGASGHMGIVTGKGRMISALNPQLGTLASPIQGYGPTNTWQYRRLSNITPGTSTATTGSASAGAGAGLLLPLLAGAAIVAAGVGVVLLAAAAAGLGGEVVAFWAISQLTGKD